MFAFILYIIALLAFAVAPTTGVWIPVLVIAMLIHWKFWLVGIIAFLVGAGWRKPF